ncbi:Ig-like domain-containing protein [Sediminicola luteus]|uniref:PKD/Chitinase domain-containing protein n=1 Tax=Sediminicola luteus TaxID=319238 RepID=A0A2A4G9D5_9FLAO|nr:T9SS type A sorting domain-containing protein [Sediminicola luteus]PCE65053.1 hypothetical protein B7P33_07845 [Sediminicola luteus]
MWSTAGDGSFDDANSATAVYTPGANDINGGTVVLTWTTEDPTGPCVGDSDTMTVTINEELVAEAGEDQTICSGATVSLSGNPSPGMWSTAGDGSFDDANSATAVYTPGANDIDGGTVVLTWTTEDPTGPCVGDSDTMTVTINEELVAEAGDDQTICSGGTVSLTGNPSPGMWSTAGDGTFDDASSATAVYTPGANDIDSGAVVLTWTTEDPTGPCVGDSDTMTVTINEELVAEAGDDQTICSGATVSLSGNPSPGMWSTAGDGSFDDANSATAIYTPGANDISGGTVVLTWTTEDPTGPCVGDSDTMTVTINEELVADAGDDQTICSGSTVSLTGNPSPGMWSTAGDGTFDDASSATAVYTPGANDIDSGAVVLTWTTEDPTGPCVGDSDTMTVTINEELVAEAGDDQTICSGATVSLSGNPSPGMWSTAGDGSFDDANSATAVYTPGANDISGGTVVLTWTTEDPTGPCVGDSDTMTVTINEELVADVGDDQTICSGGTVNLTGSPSPGMWSTAGDGSFDDASSATAVYTPGANDVSGGTVVLTWTTEDPTGPCVGDSDTMTVTINPAPVIEIANQEVCEDTTIVNLTDLEPAGQTGGVWSNGGGILGDATIADPATGPFTYTYTDGNGCEGSDTVAYVINPLPIITISEAPTCSADLTTYSLSVTVSTGTVSSTSGTVTDNGGGSWTVSGIDSGTDVTLTVMDDNDCMAELAVMAPDCSCPVVEAPVGSGQNECLMDPAQTLTAMATVGAGEVVDWYDAATGGTPVASPTLTGVGSVIYYAEARNTTTNCTSATRTPIGLKIYPLPTIMVSDGPTCAADLKTYSVSVTVSTGTVSSTSGTVTDNGGGSWTVSGIDSGTDVTLTVMDDNDCMAELAVMAPDCSCPVVEAPVGSGQNECLMDPAQTLTAMATVGAGEVVDWYDAATGGTPVASPTLTGVGSVIYYAEARNTTTNCTSATRTPITLEIQKPQYPGANGELTICAGETVTVSQLFAALGGIPGSGGFWTPTLAGAGTYTYTIAASGSCPEVSAEVVVTETQLSCAFENITNVTTVGGNDGSATVVVTGGTAPFTFYWGTSSTSTSATATDLSAGTHTVTVYDANQCMTSCEVTIEEPDDPLVCSIKILQNALCKGDDNGKAEVFASGGAGGYTYLWDNGETTAIANNLTAGLHRVTVTDGNGNTTSCTVCIVEPEELLCNISQINAASSATSNDGSATVNATGGTEGYTYLWDNGETTQTATALPPGIRWVTVTDANGCTTQCSICITYEEEELVCSVALVEELSCFGASNASAKVTADGGSGGYTYLWDNGETTATAIGLDAGVHTVTVTDSNGNTTTCNICIVEPKELLCNVSLGTASSGGPDGSATVTVTGGVGPFTYLWENGETTATATSLTPGVHEVTVIDSKGCETSCSICIPEELEELACSIEQRQQISCHDGNDGSALVTATGGSGGYTYLWDNGETTALATMLTAGVHKVTVTDSNGNTTTCSICLGEPDDLTCAVILENGVTSFGGNDGRATVSVDGGVGPYTYDWDNGETAPTAIALTAGEHQVTVTDKQGCITYCTVVVTQPDEMGCTAMMVDPVSCYGGNDGKAMVNPSGGTAPYTYEWSDGQTTQVAAGLSAGAYSVTVKDANGTTSECKVEITGAPELLCEITQVSHVSTYGANDGSATVTPTGGNPAYTYEWSNGKTSASVDNLAPGEYSVKVMDANSCYTTCVVTITQPDPEELVCDIDAVTHISCYGDDTGSITASHSGGVAPFEYFWNTGDNTPTISGLVAGTYSVTITDSMDQSCTKEVTLTQPDMALTCNLDQHTDVTTPGGSDGEATVLVAGGTAPYTYSWSTGSIEDSITNLVAGEYSVTVTDANNCKTTCSVTITEPQPVELVCSVATQTHVDCYGADTGAIGVTVSGGTAPYSYSWNTGATTPSIDGLMAGTYTVTVTDNNGETCFKEVDITQPDTALTCDISQYSDVTTPGGSDGVAQVLVMGGTAPYTYLWSTGATTETIDGLMAGHYSVKVYDANDCETFCEVTISEPEPDELILEVTLLFDVLCNNGTDGEATVEATGGVAPYSYTWSHGPTTPNVSGLMAGDYTVTVTDATMESVELMLTIDEPMPLECMAQVVTPVSVMGGTDGSVTVMAEGGSPGYIYEWSNGDTGQTIENLSAGTYSVTVTDKNGCTTECEVTLEDGMGDSNGFCTYTQGFYGNANGSACLPNGSSTNALGIMTMVINANGGQAVFGNATNNFTLTAADIAAGAVFDILPGGGSPAAFNGTATYPDSGSWSAVPLNNNGKSQNVLFSQALTYYFNLNLNPALAYWDLQPTFHTSALESCGSDTAEEATETFTIPMSVINYLNSTNQANGAYLFDLANAALGGENPGGLALSDIVSALDAINRGFDECRVLRDTANPEQTGAPAPGNTVKIPTKFKVMTYPVPFKNRITLEADSPYRQKIKVDFISPGGKVYKKTEERTLEVGKNTWDCEVGNLPSGVYLVRVKTDKETLFRKVVKK